MTTRQVLSSTELLGLYDEMQEEERLKQVDQIVMQVYDYAVRQAKGNPATTFIYTLPQDDQLKKFYLTNMSDIVAGLLACFPQSTITRKSILRTPDGMDHDISLPLIPNINRLGQLLEAIVIDWT